MSQWVKVLQLESENFYLLGGKLNFGRGKSTGRKLFLFPVFFVFFWRGEGGGEGMSTLLANCGETYPISHSPIRENPSVSQKHSGLHLDQKLNFNKQ